MFSLFYGLWKHLFSKAEFHVLILGIDKAGKTIGLRTIWEKYYGEAHAIVYVIDAASPSTFEDSKPALERVLRHEDLHGAPLLILANKQDLPGAVSAEDLARYLDQKKLDERLYMFEAVSAYDGMGIKSSIIEWFAGHI